MAKSSDTVTLGVGDLFIDGQDAGYLGGEVTVTTETEKVDFTTGTHKTLVKRFITTLNRTIKAKLAQIDIDTLKTALGIGERVQNGNNNRLLFGNNWTLATLNNVKFVHTRADGKKVVVFFPKAQVEPGSSELTFSADNVIMQDVTISAVEDTTRTDCPMGFIQVGDSDDTAAWSSGGSGGGSGSGGSGTTPTALISTVASETVTYSSSDPHYTLAHTPCQEVVVKSADGQTTYEEEDDYNVDPFGGRILTTENTTITSGSSLTVSYKYINNATVVSQEAVTMSNGTGTLAHTPYMSLPPMVENSSLTTGYESGTDYTISGTTITAVAGGSMPDNIKVTYTYLT